MEPGTSTSRLMTPAEVAALFRVDPKTIWMWAKAGKLRRYPESEIRAILAGQR